MTYTKKMTEGSELKHIILFTLPLFAGNVFQQLYNIVDSIIVGKFLGSDKLAAVGTTGSLTYLFSTLCIGLSVGAGILISQRFGAGMHKEVKKLITNSAYVILAFGAVVTVISVALAGLLMKMMNTPENLLQDATSYMRAACSGTICVAAYNWINAVMRSLGDSRTPLIFLVVASLLNVGLDLLFVVVFGWGVVGAAYATVISQGISAAGSIIVGFRRNPYFRLTREDAKPVGEVCRKCITTGIPIALQNAMISVSIPATSKISAISRIRSTPLVEISSSLPRNGETYVAPALAARSACAAENTSVTFVLIPIAESAFVAFKPSAVIGIFTTMFG